MATTTPLSSSPLESATWIDANWMFISQLVGLLVLLRLYLLADDSRGSGGSIAHINKRRKSRINPSSPSQLLLQWYAWLLVPVYAVHQFEEHAWDFQGKRYAFMDYFNEAGKHLGVELTPRLITIINTVAVWFSFPICAW